SPGEVRLWDITRLGHGQETVPQQGGQETVPQQGVVCQERPVLRGHQGGVWSLAFTPDGQTLVSASDDLTVKVWSVTAGEERFTLRGHQGPVWSLAIPPNGRTLATGSFDGNVYYTTGSLADTGYYTLVRTWDLTTGRALTPFKSGETGLVWSVDFSPDG